MSELEPPSPRCCGISPLVKQPAMNSTGSTGRHSPARSSHCQQQRGKQGAHGEWGQREEEDGPTARIVSFRWGVMRSLM